MGVNQIHRTACVGKGSCKRCTSARRRTELCDLRKAGKYINDEEFGRLYRTACSLLDHMLRSVKCFINLEGFEIQGGKLYLSNGVEVTTAEARKPRIAVELSHCLYNMECTMAFVCLLGMPVQRNQVFQSAPISDVRPSVDLQDSRSADDSYAYSLLVDAATEKNAWALAYRPVDPRFPSQRLVPLPRDATTALEMWLNGGGREMFILCPLLNCSDHESTRTSARSHKLRACRGPVSVNNQIFLNARGRKFSGESFGKVISIISSAICGNRLTLTPRVFRKLRATYFVRHIYENEPNGDRRRALLESYAYLEGHTADTLLSQYVIIDTSAGQDDVLEAVNVANRACRLKNVTRTNAAEDELGLSSAAEPALVATDTERVRVDAPQSGSCALSSQLTPAGISAMRHGSSRLFRRRPAPIGIPSPQFY